MTKTQPARKPRALIMETPRGVVVHLSIPVETIAAANRAQFLRTVVALVEGALTSAEE